MSSRFIGSGREKEGGFIATHKHDFMTHTNGVDFRHNATHIDMSPAIASPYNGSTVQSVLEQIIEQTQAAIGSFISIGNANAIGDYTVGSIDTPTLNDAFTAAFANARLVNGGLILVKAGTYALSNTVVVPANVSIMGEIGGTIISGETNENPLFLITAPTNFPVISISGTPVPTYESIEGNKFFNMVIGERIDGGAFVQTTSIPLIDVELGASFECENVTFIGRMNALGAGPAYGRAKTKFAIAVGTTGLPANQTKLVVRNCVIDGVMVGIDFTEPSVHSNLTVENCRARTFGDDLPGGVEPDNCFVRFSRGTVKCTNNYHVGGGKNVIASYVYTENDTDLNLILIGNSGTPSPAAVGFPFSGETKKFYYQAGTPSIGSTSIVSGNSWGTVINQGWVISLGDGVTSIGDINGPNAIDVLFDLYSGFSYYQTPVVKLGYGAYTIERTGATDNLSNFFLLGQKVGKNYPVVTLAVADVATDYLLNKFVGFGGAKSVKFVSDPDRHSVRIGGFDDAQVVHSAGSYSVEDCIFVDTSLIMEKVEAGNNSYPILKVDGCQFFSVTEAEQSVDLLLPPAKIVSVTNCTFDGYGYGLAYLSVGSYTSEDYPENKLFLENLNMELDGVSAASPGGATTRYVYVTDATVRVFMKGCRFSSVATPMATITDFKGLCDINCFELFVDDCIFIGPNQTYTSSGDKAMVGLRVNAMTGAHIKNSYFSGQLPLQFTGDTMNNGDKLDISGCTIDGNSLTVLDIDVDRSITPTSLLNYEHITINNCNFYQNATDITDIERDNFDKGSHYGMIDIWAGSARVSFTNNKIKGRLPDSDLQLIAGVYINAYDLDEEAAYEGNIAGVADVSGNDINILNSFGSANVLYSAFGIYTKASVNKIVNNNINFVNNNDTDLYPLCNTAGCLGVYQIPTNLPYSAGEILGNIFSRYLEGGSVADYPHKVNTVYIDPLGDGYGLISENVFSDTYVGTPDSGEEQINSDLPDGWAIGKNVNYIRDIGVISASGKHMITPNGLSAGFAFTQHLTSVPTDGIIKETNGGDYYHVDGYTVSWTVDTVAAFIYQWAIPLNEILPIGAKLISASVALTADETVSNAGGIITFSIENTSVIASDSLDFSTITNGTMLLEPAPATKILPDANGIIPFIRIYSNGMQDAGAALIRISPITIRYTW